MTIANQVEAFTEGLVVLRRMDSGQNVGFWLVRMTAPELEQWWINQETFDDNPNGAFDELYRALGQTPPPHSRVHYPGVFLTADSNDDYALWDAMLMDGKHYRCVICCDADSYLKRPDGTMLQHRGAKDVSGGGAIHEW